MARKLTASDRKSLIRLASSLPKGSPERRAILSGISGLRTGGDFAPKLDQEDLLKFWSAEGAINKFNENPRGRFDETRLEVEGEPKMLGAEYMGSNLYTGEHTVMFKVEYPVSGKIIRDVSVTIDAAQFLKSWKEMNGSGRSVYQSILEKKLYRWAKREIGAGQWKPSGKAAKSLERNLGTWDLLPSGLRITGQYAGGLILEAPMEAYWAGGKSRKKKDLQDALSATQKELGLKPTDKPDHRMWEGGTVEEMVKDSLRLMKYDAVLKLKPVEFRVPMTGDESEDFASILSMFVKEVKRYSP